MALPRNAGAVDVGCDEGAYALRLAVDFGFDVTGIERLEPAEADFLWSTMGVVPSSAEHELTLAAIAKAGLRVDEHIVVRSEWGQWSEENHGKGSRKLLHLSRLLQSPNKYIDKYGQAAYDIMIGDCLWRIYGLIGKLSRHVFVLSRR